MKRRCGWLKEGREAPVKLVWARGPVVTEECPRTAVTAASLAWLEMFAVWKRLGGSGQGEWSAKDAEAMAVLDEEWEKERSNATQGR